MNDEIPPSRVAGCVLAGLALIAGVWHTAFGLSLLMNLPLATHRWIVASRDPDFWLDAGWFRTAGAVLAVMALGAGLFSIQAAGRTFASRYEPPRHWLLLFALVLCVSVLRGFADMIAGVLTPWRVLWFAGICALYALLWAVDRPPQRPPRRAALE